MTDPSDALKRQLREVVDGDLGPIDDQEAAAQELTEVLGLDKVGVAVTGGRIVGRGSSASVDLYLSNGEAITFETVRDFGTPKTLMLELAICTGARAKLTADLTYRAVVLLRALSELCQSWSDDDVSRGWGMEYLQSAKTLEVDMRDQADRWRAFSELDAANPASDARTESIPLAKAQTVLVDERGVRLVRAGWFLAFVREQVYISPRELANRMERVGWSRPGGRGAIKATAPGRRTRPLIWNFYTVEPGWEDVDGD